MRATGAPTPGAFSPTSINDLVGTHEEKMADRETKRFGGLHVDDEVEMRGALKR